MNRIQYGWRIAQMQTPDAGRGAKQRMAVSKSGADARISEAQESLACEHASHQIKTRGPVFERFGVRVMKFLRE